MADVLPRAQWVRTLPSVIVGVCVMILDPDDRILLVRYGPSQPGSGRWWMPGGMLDHYEAPHHAGVREVLEETGIALQGELPLIGVDFRVDVGGTGPVIDYFFNGGILAPGHPVRLSPEHDRHAFVHPTELGSLPLAAHHGTLTALHAAALSGEPVYLHEGRPLHAGHQDV
ncbi:NUDIX hydrolase [Streptomyces sp. NPDC002523]